MVGGQKVPLLKICDTYSTMVKLGTVIPYLEKIQKIYEHVTHPSSSADISIFSPEISNFCCIKKIRYRLHFNRYFVIILTFFESLRDILINVVEILMMSEKLATLGLLKRKVIFVNDVTN